MTHIPLNGDAKTNCSTKNKSDKVVYEPSDKLTGRNLSVEEAFIEKSGTISPAVSGKPSVRVNHASLKYDKSDLYERWVLAREDSSSTKTEIFAISST